MATIKYFLTIFLVLFSHTSQAKTFERLQILMGDVPVSITIKTSTAKKQEAFAAMQEAFAVAQTIENEVSEFKAESFTGQLNRQACGGWVKISRHLLTILKNARQISEQTAGAFDVTFASANKQISFADVIIDTKNQRARLQKTGVKIGLSAIAKGYIVDRMADVLAAVGYKKFLLNAGGDLYAGGKWRVKIYDPTAQRNLMLTLNNQAAATSGLYERGAHIFDPRSHQSVAPDYLSATIVAEKTVLADALATAAFVAGPEKTRQILIATPQAYAMFLYQNRFERVDATRY